MAANAAAIASAATAASAAALSVAVITISTAASSLADIQGSSPISGWQVSGEQPPILVQCVLAPGQDSLWQVAVHTPGTNHLYYGAFELGQVSGWRVGSRNRGRT